MPVLERALPVRFAAFLCPVLCKPSAELVTEGTRRIARRIIVLCPSCSGLGPRSLRCPGQDQIGQFGAGARRAAEPGKVGVHSSKFQGASCASAYPTAPSARIA